MKVAVPVVNGMLCMHFGHCQEFALVVVDDGRREIVSTQSVVPPPHEPGLLPRWLHEQGVTTVISGGMGMRAQQIFAEHGIEVVVGASAEAPAEVVKKWLDGSLVTGDNVCSH